MKNISVNIIGKGLFGTFLKDLFEEIGVSQDLESEHVILAVPLSAYPEVAEQYKDKHLINVCSVQEGSNNICVQYSKSVTGIHPMFGPQSPKEGRTVVITRTCKDSDTIINLFKKCGCGVVEKLPDGRVIDGKIHDQMMAVTHGTSVKMADSLKPLVQKADWVPENCQPASFKRLKEAVEQLQDMSPGTAESIAANKYL